MISIGVCQWSLDRHGPGALTRASELGFGVIHLDGDELARDSWLPDGPVMAATYAQAADATGVRIEAISPGRLNALGLTSPDGSEAASSCERSIAVAIAAATTLGAPLIFLPSFGNGEIRDEAGLRRTAEVLRWTCDAAADHGLLIATENTLGAADNMRLLDLVDRPNARILLDTLNPALWGHDVASYVESLWPHLADQVHVKDGRGGKMGNAALGDGEARLEATVAVLKTNGFDGSLVSENDYPGDGVGAARDIAWLTESFGTGV